MNAAILRQIAKEARPVIERMLDDAEVLAALGRACRDKEIDWAALKALIKGQIRDDRDESGSGQNVARIVERADAASAYAGVLSGEKNFSDNSAETTAKPAAGAPPPAGEICASSGVDDGIPAFLDRRPAAVAARP